MSFSIEKLVHFNCSNCAKWWCIGDADTHRGYFCPWCGKFEKHFKKDIKNE